MKMSEKGSKQGKLSAVVSQHQSDILASWIREQGRVRGRAGASLGEAELRDQCSEFLRTFGAALKQAAGADIEAVEWKDVRGMLEDLSKARVALGFSPSETASFVMSLKRPYLSR